MSDQPHEIDPIKHVADQCLRVFTERPAGLLTDIDGTISLIAPTPDSAFVEEAAIVALAWLALRLDVVGLVSGRAAANAESMVAVPGLVYIGNHGFERRAAGVTVVNPHAVKAIGAVADVLEKVQHAVEFANLGDGVIFENKGVTGSVHYRLAHDQEATRNLLLAAITEAANGHGLRVSEGRMVIEIRPAIAINKGTAVRAIVEEHRIRGLVFLGDDITDIDAFNALSALRSDGVLNGVNVAVVSAESPPEVAKAADVSVPGVEACVKLLTVLANALSTNGAKE